VSADDEIKLIIQLPEGQIAKGQWYAGNWKLWPVGAVVLFVGEALGKRCPV
jgi:hypothetical protein